MPANATDPDAATCLINLRRAPRVETRILTYIKAQDRLPIHQTLHVGIRIKYTGKTVSISKRAKRNPGRQVGKLAKSSAPIALLAKIRSGV